MKAGWLAIAAASMRAYGAAATLAADAEPGRRDLQLDTERTIVAGVLDDALMASLRRMAQVSATTDDPTPSGHRPPARGRQPATIQRNP